MPEMPTISDYASAEAWLLSMTDYERLLGSASLKYDTQSFDLDNFRRQLAHLGDPHLKYAVIHVAGTKGKGSTCAFLESALRHCGYRTGLFTSPHLFRFTERIRLDGQDISDADFCRLIDQMSRLMAPTPRPDTKAAAESAAAAGFRTVFEILTASAFQYFAENQVDIAIIETGLGGRLDSTNMFNHRGDGPLIDVITAIGLDHTAILGDSITAITGEKAGIIQPHATTIVAPQTLPATQTIVRQVVHDRCETVKAPSPLMVTDCITFSDVGQGPDCYNFTLQTGHAPTPTDLTATLEKGFRVCPSLHGRHQAANVSTALVTLVELEKLLAAPEYAKPPAGKPRPALDPARIRHGLEQTQWPGRFQVIPGDVPVVIDGAHCAISAAALASACRQQFSDRPVFLIAGFLRDKSGAEMLGAIFRELPVTGAIALVPPTPRAVSADHIKEALAAYLPPAQITTADSMDKAIKVAREEARRQQGYIIVFGSLYLVGPALRAAGPA